MKFNIIGTGRLGKNLVHALTAHRIADLEAVCNSSLKSGQDFVSSFGKGTAFSNPESMPAADITIIACTDDAIEGVVNHLEHNHQLKPGSIVIHCSGVLSSAIMETLHKKGCLIGSMHPLKAFSLVSASAFDGVDVVIEGDADVCTWLNYAFSKLGSQILNIKPEDKALYHAAACMAANYVVTIAHYAQELFVHAGLSEKQSKAVVSNLIQSDLDNLKQSETIDQTLTGPLMRGDVATLGMHLHAIPSAQIKELYKDLGIKTLPLTRLSKEKKEEIVKLFT